MNFFEHQDQARRNSRRLVVLFLLGVAGVVVTIHVVLALLWGMREVREEAGRAGWSSLTDPAIFAVSAAIALTIIAIGSLTKIAELRGGGRVVAERLGGRLIPPDSQDLVERKVLNVVEEMSIASGLPTPPVYMMDNEASINAFAAGYAPESAVVGVSRGCVERLSRDELQGVVAHEFSHILNGDMRLNIRLIGMVHGLIAIGLTGWFLLRMMMYSGGARRRSSGGGKGGDPRIFLLLLGLALIVIGFIGSFFGELIKAAVSRQREFLADAAAVQFTRNPSGIGGALKKIGGLSMKGRLGSPAAAEMRHMFFATALRSGLAGLFSTHPPLPDRIRAVEPDWDGRFLSSEPARRAEPAEETREDRLRKLGRVLAGAGGAAMMADPSAEDIDTAHELIREIPEAFLHAVRDPSDARAAILAILLDPANGEVRRRQIEILEATASRETRIALKRLVPMVQRLERRSLLPIVDLAQAALSELSPEQYKGFREQVGQMIYVDERVDLLEWVLQRVLIRSLDLRFGLERSETGGKLRVGLLNREASIALSMLAHAGRDDLSGARRAFNEAARSIKGADLAFLPPTECGLTRLERALNKLVKLRGEDKRVFIEACEVCINADRAITAHEAELFRALAVSLGVPTPPVAPG